jgi:hypothetical protein
VFRQRAEEERARRDPQAVGSAEQRLRATDVARAAPVGDERVHRRVEQALSEAEDDTGCEHSLKAAHERQKGDGRAHRDHRGHDHRAAAETVGGAPEHDPSRDCGEAPRGEKRADPTDLKALDHHRHEGLRGTEPEPVANHRQRRGQDGTTRELRIRRARRRSAGELRGARQRASECEPRQAQHRTHHEHRIEAPTTDDLLADRRTDGMRENGRDPEPADRRATPLDRREQHCERLRAGESARESDTLHDAQRVQRRPDLLDA